MNKYEKIISGLEHCVYGNCKGCPYQSPTRKSRKCTQDLLEDTRDAVKHLLKTTDLKSSNL